MSEFSPMQKRTQGQSLKSGFDVARREQSELLADELEAVNGPQGGALPEQISNRINSKRGTGSSLAADFLDSARERFGRDMSDVRVHQDEESDQLNKSLNARAFTVGSDVFLSSDVHPTSGGRDGQTLMHELTHVVQQDGSAGGGPLQLGAVDTPQEHEAQLSAADADTGLSAVGNTVQRVPEWLKKAGSGIASFAKGAGKVISKTAVNIAKGVKDSAKATFFRGMGKEKAQEYELSEGKIQNAFESMDEAEKTEYNAKMEILKTIEPELEKSTKKIKNLKDKLADLRRENRDPDAIDAKVAELETEEPLNEQLKQQVSTVTAERNALLRKVDPDITGADIKRNFASSSEKIADIMSSGIKEGLVNPLKPKAKERQPVKPAAAAARAVAPAAPVAQPAAQAPAPAPGPVGGFGGGGVEDIPVMEAQVSLLQAMIARARAQGGGAPAVGGAPGGAVPAGDVADHAVPVVNEGVNPAPEGKAPVVDVGVDAVPDGKAPGVDVGVDAVPEDKAPVVDVGVDAVPDGKAPGVDVGVDAVPVGEAEANAAPGAKASARVEPADEVADDAAPAAAAESDHEAEPFDPTISSLSDYSGIPDSGDEGDYDLSMVSGKLDSKDDDEYDLDDSNLTGFMADVVGVGLDDYEPTKAEDKKDDVLEDFAMVEGGGKRQSVNLDLSLDDDVVDDSVVSSHSPEAAKADKGEAEPLDTEDVLEKAFDFYSEDTSHASSSTGDYGKSNYKENAQMIPEIMEILSGIKSGELKLSAEEAAQMVNSIYSEKI